ncbi:hypothetical protein P170DRAFT_494775 [Aspergillus steynii IBT 23096]|uniref:F-box domain-containing protein n=1 Tax=Aspergillus steynii IBT 23096 TaxID=1392250 RepID=A0A2I2G874_9EURO|nr:uncharacterized protein P170DRAFT_494775 [Aspergillus steynii IBT 23096]PLB49087.1 hypothetical protein P170DRAFT_494775 [Aspergillus steynii IBT 23096]
MPSSVTTTLQRAKSTLQNLLPGSSKAHLEGLNPEPEAAAATAKAEALNASKHHNIQHSDLVRLPQELIDMIAENLPPLGLAVLAISCCAMYRKLRTRLAEKPCFRIPRKWEDILAIENDGAPSPYEILQYLENQRWKYCTQCYTMHPRGEFARIKKEWRRTGKEKKEEEEGKEEDLMPYCETPGLVSICREWSISYREARRLVKQIRSCYVPRECVLEGLKPEGEDAVWSPFENYIPWKEFHLKQKLHGVTETVHLTVKVCVALERGVLCFGVICYARLWQMPPEHCGSTG